MAKQKNAAPEKSSKPASSGSGGPGVTKPIRKIDNGGSVHGKQVGPSKAPYYQKG
jgi:hypothetical protein